MSKFERQLREDKLLRDSAHALVKANVARVKSDLEERSLGQRAVGRVKDGTAELVDRAKENGGTIAGLATVLLGAVGLWAARAPLLDMLTTAEPADPDGDEGETPSGEHQ
ncbi:hypothetical protein [Parerythrobacter aestuarii]|uniref:hypothetical protein n=1 Tax=Parerythrobacter aestuarii TaxID=3020909 RepID=UPI0024DE3C0E|nr:hypothetical protein [Parerythrobacter aestuarii]